MTEVRTLLVVVIAVLVVFVVAVWAMRRVRPGEAAARQPLDILRERYARGELSREQFDQMRRDIEA